MIKILTVALALLASPASSAMAETVRLGLQPWLGYGPLWVAEQKGYFKKHGLDLQLTTFNWDRDMTDALVSGNVDVIAAATNVMISNFNRGIDQKGFLILDLSFEADAILVRKSVNAIADLKHKRIAFEGGATSDLLINYALRRNGLSISDVEHVEMSASDAGFALLSGNVDAAVTYEPYISAALARNGDCKVLYTAAEKPGLISDMLTASSEWIEDHPNEVQAIIRAWNDAVRFIRQNPDEGGAIIANAVGSSMDEFSPAFRGIRLYDVAENVQFLEGAFQTTLQEIGEIMRVNNPQGIKTIPGPEDLLALDGLYSVAE